MSNSTTKQTIEIRQATKEDDTSIAQHFYLIWRDNNVSDESIKPDWFKMTLDFIDDARQNQNYQAFVADVEGIVVASASCQLFSGLYPRILQEQYRHYGYIWNVYVKPAYRGQGIAKQLLASTQEYLKSLGCTRAILHASPLGKPVYEHLGFQVSNEMLVDL